MDHKTLIVHTVLLAQKYNLLWHVCTDSRACEGPRGFPDLFVIGEVGEAFIELKTEHDDTTAEQDLWRYRIMRTVVDYRLFRPSDLFDGTIESFFSEIALPESSR